jgi:serine/threonine protein phosphatase 1
MFGVSRDKQGWPSGPAGQTAYVVGDIHGRLDLLDQLLERIRRDIAERRPEKTLLVFLGDLLDRGPDSAGVVERLRTYRRDGVRAIFLLGNHEEVLLRIVAGEAQLIPSWLRFGGAQCLRSYGGDPLRIATLGDAAAVEAIRAVIPPEHLEFIGSFADTCRFGDYLFVHAGIRPGVELDQQTQQDLRWIREPFLADETDHGFVVIHGHTIRPEIEERPNRIGIDTGAYATGVLTALVIDGPERRHLDTREPVDADVSAMH